MRFADALLRNGFGEIFAVIPLGTSQEAEEDLVVQGRKSHARILSYLRHEHFPIIVADGVDSYLYNTTIIDAASKCCALVAPFPAVWIEWKPRNKQESGFTFAGVLIEVIDPSLIFPDAPENTDAWLLHAFIQRPKEESILEVYPPMRVQVKQDSRELDGAIRIAIIDSKADTSFNDQCQSIATIALTAITFMNCKNVRLVDVEQPLAVRQSRKRKGKYIQKTYKTLEITTIKGIIDRARCNPENMGKSPFDIAMHVCRAHLKTYTEDHKLFGKYTGTWLWAPQVRGKEDAGEVVKQYSVKFEKD